MNQPDPSNTTIANVRKQLKGLHKTTMPAVATKKLPAAFLPAVAHEIRNPLATIKLAVQFLQKTNLDTHQQLCVDSIIHSEERINKLVNDLLLRDQPAQSSRSGCFIRQLLEEVVSLSEDRIKLNNIHVVRQYPARDIRIKINNDKIRIALTNIVVNAIEAMPRKNAELKLNIKVKKNKCHVAIADNGAGISKENIGKIFKPYFTARKDGLGLGLSATWSILKANHATIEVQSEPGKGTVFNLFFLR